MEAPTTASRGLTLVEVAVGLAVAGVLASVAMPSYQAQLAKARRAEAIGALLRVQAAQEQFRGHHGSYALEVSALRVLPPQDAQLSLVFSGAHAGGYIARVRAAEHHWLGSGCAEITLTVADGVATQGAERTLLEPVMKHRACRVPAPAGGGFTLLEMMIAIALLALLVSLALPSLAPQVARTRLKAAAEALAADMAEARHEAVRRARPLHLHFENHGTAGGWCWAVATSPGCDCRVAAQSCTVRVVAGREHPGVELVEARDSRFEPVGTSDVPGTALLRSARGDLLRVQPTRLGRARICAPQEPVAGYPAC